MVVDDFYVEGVTLLPTEADTPPVIDPNTVSATKVALQGLEAVGRGSSQILERLCTVEHSELPQRESLDVARKPTSGLSVENGQRLFRFEGPYHTGRL